MNTKRTRITRPRRGKYPPEAVEIFARMQKLEPKCTCVLLADETECCPTCEAWWAEHSKLHRLLRAKLWEWPCIESPDYDPPAGENRYSPPDVEAQQRYKQLARMARPQPRPSVDRN